MISRAVLAFFSIATACVLASCTPKPEPRSWQDVYGGAIPMKVFNDSDYAVVNVRVWNKETGATQTSVIADHLAPHESKTMQIRPGHYEVAADGAFKHDAPGAKPVCSEPDDCRDVRPDSFDVTALKSSGGFRIVFFRVSSAALPANLNDGDVVRLAIIPKGGASKPATPVVPLPDAQAPVAVAADAGTPTKPQ